MRPPAKRSALAAILVGLISAADAAPDDEAMLLNGAAYCLAAKGFLPYQTAKNLTLGYWIDRESYSPKVAMYVVNYRTGFRERGAVFTVFPSREKEHLHFDIQNNADFVISKNSKKTVLHKSAPRGVNGRKNT